MKTVVAPTTERGRWHGTHGVKPPCHVLGHFLQAAQPWPTGVDWATHTHARRVFWTILPVRQRHPLRERGGEGAWSVSIMSSVLLPFKHHHRGMMQPFDFIFTQWKSGLSDWLHVWISRTADLCKQMQMLIKSWQKTIRHSCLFLHRCSFAIL